MMRKTGAEIYAVIFIVALLAISIFSFFFVKKGEIFFAPPVVGYPTDCSAGAIAAVWDTMFDESSTGINITTNTSRADACEHYYAWKQAGGFTWAMAGFFSQDYTIGGTTIYANSSGIVFLWGNFTGDINASVLMLNSAQVGNGQGIEQVVSLRENAETEANPWPGPVVADVLFAYVYRYANETPFLSTGGEYVFSGGNAGQPQVIAGSNATISIDHSYSGMVNILNQTVGYVTGEMILVSCVPSWQNSTWGACNGSVQNRTVWDEKNCGISYGMPATTQPCGCISNWTAVNASACNANETFVVWYNDTNMCVNATRPANTTGYCDYNLNGLIGMLNDVGDDNLDINLLKIDDVEVNYSKNYTGEKEVELYEKNGSVETRRVRFDFNFNSGPLNLKTIRIERQDDESYGYMIVEGLAVNNKDFYVDRIKNSGSVCVKDSVQVDSLGDISNGCSGSDEVWVDCPGSEGEFSCNLDTSGVYTVRGLDNSGVREIVYTQTTGPSTNGQNQNGASGCRPAWDCGLWGECTNGIRMRTCTDYSICPNATKSYNETQSCVAGGACTPSWDCGEWIPVECTEGEQTRTCVDKNGCEQDRVSTRECDGGIDWLVIGFVAVAVLIISVAVILIWMVKRKRDAEARAENSVYGILERPAAGTYGRTHYGGR